MQLMNAEDIMADNEIRGKWLHSTFPQTDAKKISTQYSGDAWSTYRVL